MDVNREQMPRAEARAFGSTDRSIPSELQEAIASAEVVSFDVFDTLLERPCEYPTELFDHLGEDVAAVLGLSFFDFRGERVEAERLARERAFARGDEEVTLREIYEVFAERLGIDATRRDAVCALELAIERDVLRPRSYGAQLYRYAHRMKKRIVVASDVYLPHSFVDEALSASGFRAHERLYVSSQVQKQKHHGTMFDLIATELEVEPSRVLHIGDNAYADIERAIERGFRTWHIPRPTEAFSLTPMYQRLWAREPYGLSYCWRSVLATLARDACEPPTRAHTIGSPFEGSAYRLGFDAFGPFLLAFTKWVLEQARRDGYRRLYFLARDGKIMLDAYERVARCYDDAPEGVYLLCSRRAVNIANLRTEGDVFELLYCGIMPSTPGDLLRDRMGIDPVDVPLELWAKHGLAPNEHVPAHELRRVVHFGQELSSQVLANAAREREAYLAYLDEIGLRGDVRSAVVDIGYGGSMQRSLDGLVTGEHRLGGFYVVTFRDALRHLIRRGLNARGYLGELFDSQDSYHPFCRHIPLFETLFSSSETSLVRMVRDRSGRLRPEYFPFDPKELRRVQVTAEIQRGALDFVERFTSAWGRHLPRLDLEPNKAVRAIVRYFDAPDPVDARILQGVPFEDAFSGNGTRVLIPEDDALGSEPGIWTQGTAALLRGHAAPLDGVGAGLEGALTSIVERAGGVGGPALFRIVDACVARALGPRKLVKYRRDPVRFFADSPSPAVRSLARLYALQPR